MTIHSQQGVSELPGGTRSGGGAGGGGVRLVVMVVAVEVTLVMELGVVEVGTAPQLVE